MPRLTALALALALAALAPTPADAADDPRPVKLLIITGDEVGAHDWKATTQAMRDFLSAQGRINVQVTETPAKDLTDENLAKYDAFLLNYRETKPTEETKWSDANKAALFKAVKGGKGLVVYHFASSGFADSPEFEKLIGGGWRKQGFHGPKLVFSVKATDVKHPISAGLASPFPHPIDELYSNSKMVPGNVVLATAYCDPSTPKGTGKDEPVIWINEYGGGRVFHSVLGHDTVALADPVLQEWMRRGVEWAATGDVSHSSK
jgi:type 1 glutamine amidotransferase